MEKRLWLARKWERCEIRHWQLGACNYAVLLTHYNYIAYFSNDVLNTQVLPFLKSVKSVFSALEMQFKFITNEYVFACMYCTSWLTWLTAKDPGHVTFVDGGNWVLWKIVNTVNTIIILGGLPLAFQGLQDSTHQACSWFRIFLFFFLFLVTYFSPSLCPFFLTFRFLFGVYQHIR